MRLSNKIIIFLLVILIISIAILVYGFTLLKKTTSPSSTSIEPTLLSDSSSSSVFPYSLSDSSVSPSVIPAPAGIQSSSVIPAEAGIQDKNGTSTSQNCDIKQITDTVHGGSMSGIVENGQQIIIFEGYYKCHAVQRNDLVIYNYAGNPEPLIKIVKAIPGDKWFLKLSDQGYEIVVNNKILTTSLGELYQIPTTKISMLKLYATSYPTIPQNTYLILGNLSFGTLDSSRFGLIGLQDIIGKAVIK